MAKPKRVPFAEVLAHLSCDAINAVSMHIDWQEVRGDDGEGFRSFEAVKCQECGATLVLDGGGNEKHCDVASSDMLDTNVDGDPHMDVDCDGYVGSAEGPMMNYWYPVEIKDCTATALKLVDLPLCVVEFRDGTTGLALTGGGMDLSWEICEAFIAIGYLPPVAFTRVPGMAGKSLNKTARLVIAACLKSNEVQQRWAQGNIDEIKRTVARMRKDARRKGGK